MKLFREKKKVAIFAPSIKSDHKLYFGWPAPVQKKYDFFQQEN